MPLLGKKKKQCIDSYLEILKMVFLPNFIVNEPIRAVNSSQIKQKNHVKIMKKIKGIII